MIGGNILSGSKAKMGGVKNIFLCQQERATVSGSTITMDEDFFFMKYECARDTGTFTEDMEYRRDVGQLVVTQSASFAVNNMTQQWRDEVIRMSKKPMCAVIEDRAGKYWLMGRYGGVFLNKVASSPGKAGGDRRGMEITLRAEETELSSEVTFTQGVHYLNNQNAYLQDVDGSLLRDMDGTYLEDNIPCPNNEVLADYSSSDFNNDFEI
jgi:hypothetical protein